MVVRAENQRDDYNIVIVAQQGRLTFEALLFAASLRHCAPHFNGRLLVAEPQPGPLWPHDPRISDPAALEMFEALNAQIIPFESVHFGAAYPQGNKIEMLAALPRDEPFVFFDTDTLITGDLSQVPFDFTRPTASLRREATWPKPELYNAGYSVLWRSLYDKFGLDFESTLSPQYPDEYWKKYLYFNAGFFYYKCPRAFGDLFRDYALAIRDDPPSALCAQALFPWLDQIALPLVIHALGGGRDTLPVGLLDGLVSCHYRTFPLLYARETKHVIGVLEEVASPNALRNILKEYPPIERTVYQNRGAKVRALFDQNNMPRPEAAIRHRIKSAGFWMR